MMMSTDDAIDLADKAVRRIADAIETWAAATDGEVRETRDEHVRFTIQTRLDHLRLASHELHDVIASLRSMKGASR